MQLTNPSLEELTANSQNVTAIEYSVTAHDYRGLIGAPVIPDDLSLPELMEFHCLHLPPNPANLFALISKAPKLRKLVFRGPVNLAGGAVVPADLNLSELTELRCTNSDISLANLFALIRKAPKLEKLVLRSCYNLAGGAVIPADLNLSELTELDCSDSDISLANLFALIRKAPKLEKLVLRSCYNLASGAVIPADLNLSELTELDCSGSNISSANLFALIRKAPKLRRLVFGRRVNLADELIIPADLNLSELTELDCSGSDMRPANLFALISKAPKLRKLVLSGYGNLAGELIIPADLNLPELTELDCSGSDISLANLFALIRKAPKLRKLVLSGYSNLAGELIIPADLNLSELTELDCSYSDTSPANLFALICKAPKLRRLVFGGRVNLADGVVIPADLNLSELTELDCTASTTSPANLFALICKAPKLRKLVLNGCDNLAGEAIIPADLNLSELTELDCSGSNISPANLFALLRKAPKLEKLDLRSYVNFADGVVIPADLNLSTLKQISVRATAIPPNGVLASIFTAATNLETLNLAGCANLSEEQTLNLISFIANNMQIEIRVCDDFAQRANLSATQTQLLNALIHHAAARQVFALTTPRPQQEPQKPSHPAGVFNQWDGDGSMRLKVFGYLAGASADSNTRPAP